MEQGIGDDEAPGFESEGVRDEKEKLLDDKGENALPQPQQLK